MSKVSVIIPVYGVEFFIERCARSLFEQTLDDVEFLFIDDCTPDKSIDVLKKVLEDYPQRAPQVIIHKMERNSGQAAVRKWGIQNATGEYIIQCDSDDWMDQDSCRLLYEKAISDKSDIVICDYFYVTNANEKKLYKGCNSLSKDNIIKDLLYEKISWSLCNKLIKRELYQNSGISFPNDNMGEDMAIILQLILKSDTVSYIPAALYFYCCNPFSFSNSCSEDAVLNKYEQIHRNAEIVISSFMSYGLDKRYDLSFIKWNVRKTLWRLAYKKDYYKIWCNTYPELFPALFFSSLLSFQEKIKVILTYLSIYPKTPSCRIVSVKEWPGDA